MIFGEEGMSVESALQVWAAAAAANGAYVPTAIIEAMSRGDYDAAFSDAAYASLSAQWALVRRVVEDAVATADRWHEESEAIGPDPATPVWLTIHRNGMPLQLVWITSVQCILRRSGCGCGWCVEITPDHSARIDAAQAMEARLRPR
jgi:hypothetical protein